MRTSASRGLLILVVVVLVAAVVLPWAGRGRDELVLYCAHDAALAQPVLDRFEEETGISVRVRFDEEASKSLGLVNLLIAERAAPRADVFWNNQLMGTIRLREEGVLQPYRGAGWERIPEQFRDPEGYWAGFAARCRVYIVNTELMEATPESVQSALEQPSLSRVAIAVPLFGTTFSHYCVLAESMGLTGLQQWHWDLRDRGIREVRGNAMVKDLVAEGVCALGYTDTDDAYAAVDAGAPVEMLPVRLDNGRTICLPNSVAIVAGCRHPEAARRLVDFLLHEDTELQLAAGIGRQIPLGAVDATRLPPDAQRLQDWGRDAVPLRNAAQYHAALQDWLTAESTGQ